MDNEFVIEPNQTLIDEANAVLNSEDNDDIIEYHRTLTKMINKIFEYREITFRKADEYLNNPKNMANSVVIKLDKDLEKIIEKIMKKQQQLFQSKRYNKIIFEVE